MAAKQHLVVCVMCGRQFDANRGGYYNSRTRRYTCKTCGVGPVAQAAAARPSVPHPVTAKSLLSPMIGKCIIAGVILLGGLVFLAYGGFLRNHLYRRLFSGVCEEYGFTVTAHQLRHAYASLLEEANVPEKVAQDLLGHAQISTTKDIYTHIRAAKRRRDLEALRSIDFDL